MQQKEENGKKVDIPAPNKISTADASSPYYREFNMLMVLDKNEADVKKAINALDKDVLAGKTADEYYSTMLEMRNKDFIIISHHNCFPVEIQIKMDLDFNS